MSSVSPSESGNGLPAERIPPASAPTTPLVDLREHQQALLEILRRQSDELGAIYLGALLVFYEPTHPDRLALAAHGIREVIMSLPTYFTLPLSLEDEEVQHKEERLGDKVSALRDAWVRTAKARSDGGPLPKKFLRRLEKFFDWYEEQRPRFKDRTASLLRRLDPAGRPLPTPIEDLRIEEWNSFRGFFVGVAHHADCSQHEFESWLELFEVFLLNFIRPRTFSNADQLDALIQEGEGDA